MHRSPASVLDRASQAACNPASASEVRADLSGALVKPAAAVLQPGELRVALDSELSLPSREAPLGSCLSSLARLLAVYAASSPARNVRRRSSIASASRRKSVTSGLLPEANSAPISRRSFAVWR